MRRTIPNLAVCVLLLFTACSDQRTDSLGTSEQAEVAKAQAPATNKAEGEEPVPYALATDPATNYIFGIPNPGEGWQTVRITSTEHKLLYAGAIWTWMKVNENGEGEAMLFLQSRPIKDLLGQDGSKVHSQRLADSVGSKLSSLLGERVQRTGGKVMLSFHRELAPIVVEGERFPAKLVYSNDLEADGRLMFAVTCFAVVDRSQVLSATYISRPRPGGDFPALLTQIDEELLVPAWAEKVNEYYTKSFGEERTSSLSMVSGLWIWKALPQ